MGKGPTDTQLRSDRTAMKPSRRSRAGAGTWMALLAVLLLALSGCQSSGPVRRTSIPVRFEATPPSSVPSAPVPSTEAVVIPGPPPVQQPVQPTPVLPSVLMPETKETWIPLGRWASTNGFSQPTALRVGTNVAFLVTNLSAQLLIIPGKRALRWNGVECWQGTAPQFMQGQPVLHVLDVRKTLAPLVSSIEGFALSNRVVVIDPGHGGVNAGAKSVADSRFEKDFTLDWALRLKPLLQRQGWEVHLTRTNDVDLSLTNRVTFADQKGAALFMSLHFNSNGSVGSPSGLETYCVTPAGMASSLLRGEEEVGQVNPNNAWDVTNLALAMRVHQSLLRKAAIPDRGVRRARFMGVIRLQDRPAILIEGGYLSQPAEAKLIATPDFRQRLAEGVAQALKLQ